MNQQKLILFSVTLALIGATAGLCAHMKTSRKLGLPGVKIVAQPSLGEDGKAVREQSVALPEQVLNYESKPGVISAEELRTLPADTLFGRRNYQAPDKFVLTTSVVVMGEDSRSIHKPEICLPAQGWSIANQPMTIRMLHPIPYDLSVVKVVGSKTILGKDGTLQPVKTIFVYWFVAENDLTADHVERMWKMGAEMLRSGTLQRWAYIACMAYCYPGQEDETYKRIEQFIIAAVPSFQLPPRALSSTKIAGRTAETK